MNIIGVIAEYNPFHNGHKYLLESVKTKFNPDGIICIMSGNFVQRGEPAIFSKWARTKMALYSGVDLVLELPTCFATSTAEIFAESALSLFEQIKVVKGISFGVESDCHRELLYLGKLLYDEPMLFKKNLKKYLKTGITFAAAREKAIMKYLESVNTPFSYNKLSKLLKKPNFILALEYTKAINKLDSDINILPILRRGASYHEKNVNTEFPSATAIRAALKSIKDKNGDYSKLIFDKMSKGTPYWCQKIIYDEIKSGRGPVFLDDIEPYVLYVLRRTPATEITKFFDVKEGLQNRIKRSALMSTNINELVENIKSKRYPETKIQRILVHILLDIKKDIVFQRKPLYIRILGLTPTGGKIIKAIKKQSDIPIITRTASYKNLKGKAKSMFEIDLLSSDVYSLFFTNPRSRQGAQDFTNSVIFFDKDNLTYHLNE